ncbi:MAG: YbaB/EbfC family nucleoid-associated protein [Armatimonadaceae bacterium]
MGGLGGPGGMGGPGMAKMLQDLQKKMMEDADKMQQRLEAARLEGTSGGGAVTAVVNGHGKVVEVTLNKEVVDPEDVEMLQDLIATAFREAQEQAETLRQEEQQKLMPASIPGMDLSGLF